MSAPVAPVAPLDGTLVPAGLRRRLWLLVMATVVVVAGLAAAVHDSRGPLAVERPLNDLLTRSRAHLDTEALFFADLDHPVRIAVVALVVLSVCAAARSRRAVVTLVPALAVTLVACEGLKVVVARRQILGALTFPSGHVAVASVLATVTILVARRQGPLGRRLRPKLADAVVVVAVALVVAVGASMVILGDHYVTDAVAAAPLGASITLVVAVAVDALVARFARRR